MWSLDRVSGFVLLLALTSALPMERYGFIPDSQENQDEVKDPLEFLNAEKRVPFGTYQGLSPSTRFFIDEGVRAVRRSARLSQRQRSGSSSGGETPETPVATEYPIGMRACFFKKCTFETFML